LNEELALESSLDLTLMQHFYDEDPELREVHVHLEVDPFKLDIITFFQTLTPW